MLHKFYPVLRIVLAKTKRFCLTMNSLIPRHECSVCNKKFAFFIPRALLQNPIKEGVYTHFDIIGSGDAHFCCPYCSAIDRARHLKIYFDQLGIWADLKNKKILHFAPEKHLHERIKELPPQEYILADLDASQYKEWGTPVMRIDMTAIPFADHHFDFLMANHVLEHIPDYKKALAECFRVLKPGGFAVLQTPYSPMILHNFEDPFINTDSLRESFYGQSDHVRICGQQIFHDMQEIGFIVKRHEHADLFGKGSDFYFGVNGRESLFVFGKPGC